MKKIFSLLLIVVIAVFNNCKSFKKDLFIEGGQEEAIKNAILDFSKSNNSLYKNDSVFYISNQDPFYGMSLKNINIGNSKWVRDKIYEGIIGISISAFKNKIFLPKDVKIGGKGELPSRYIEKNGKLFFWWDDDYSLNEETLKTLHKYNILESDKISALEFSIDDSQKGVHYYFCKNNLTRYEKVISNKGMGFYTPPNLKCK